MVDLISQIGNWRNFLQEEFIGEKPGTGYAIPESISSRTRILGIA
jgi:hypothetical protein